LPYHVRPMQKEDIPQVKLIDHEAFPTMLPPLNFEREMQNQMMHYYVVCDEKRLVEEVENPSPPVRNPGLISRLKKLLYPENILHNDLSAVLQHRQFICGYVGFWILADEAHITTIATREELQRQGIGELLILAVINQSRELFARELTLEVRVSNTGAQNLYLKYGFKQVGVRKHYYTDNREDAFIMTTDDITSDEYRKKIDGLSKDHIARWGKASFSYEKN
jgi:[ribosomal protein S18]-alanine N-acetyltransferase